MKNTLSIPIKFRPFIPALLCYEASSCAEIDTRELRISLINFTGSSRQAPVKFDLLGELSCTCGELRKFDDSFDSSIIQTTKFARLQVHGPGRTLLSRTHLSRKSSHCCIRYTLRYRGQTHCQPCQSILQKFAPTVQR